MAQEQQARSSFMHKLLHDKTANTLAISAAALLPLMAMVGGGIDASRYYMTAARMQAACDAGALAARRAMTDDNFTSAHRQIGLNFFDQNFNEGMFGVDSRNREYTSDGEGTVIGNATGTLPASIMAAFGYNEFNITVTCSAEINISNTDIMFVLDTTGSMADCPATSGCNSGPGSKIVALREAVMNFYDTVEAATSASAQVRYGLVPYSQQVNVGFSLPRAYMADEHSYQSRVPVYEVVQTVIPGNGVEVGDDILISQQTEWITRSTSDLGSSRESDYYYRNREGRPDRNDNDDRDRCQITNRGTYTVGSQTWTISSTSYVRQQYDDAPIDTQAGCRGTVRKTRKATQDDVIPDRIEESIRFAYWRYCQVDTADATPCNVENPAGSPASWETVDLSTLYDDNQIDLPLGNNGAFETHTWTGCVEEPSTVLTDNYSPIPAAAHDLNINLVPENESQKWKPALNTAVWERRDSSNNRTTGFRNVNGNQARPGWVCPQPARKLSEISRSDLQAYLDALNASGNTYHDIGMLWGARFLSPRGLFAAENTTAPNGDAIARHIVFMTDGAQVNNVENYSTHGIEWWDRRITGDGNSTREFNRRASRLQAICRAAQQENITVWVVAFGTTLTSNLTNCASPGRAFQANDSATLNARFQEIAQKIAALRLTS
ncbi:VWA domain-containing protein [Porphyrobacter sp. YT40]|uniref:VWA domain-containing protein n=1 Tax=Porphyrobacter sp. YT40 TaxID=2547601 RepID=UPI0011440C6D|nr:VWA domain-containing protein [Porphyrobacter sp. YT40]QDH34828.1 VWA domain-containing protein [Porphyrobacter sp. YT40]